MYTIGGSKLKDVLKKIVCALLTMSLFSACLLFSACDGKKPDVPPPNEEEEIPEEKESVLPQNIDKKDAAGNAEKYAPENVAALPESRLFGKTVYWLGSSVTYGDASLGDAVPDYIAKRNNCVCVKEAVSGTTLMKSNWSNKTYIDRLLKGALPQQAAPDLFVCQLSTNDMYYNQFGEVTADDVKDKTSFNRYTTAGAIEYIIAYAKETWNCKIAFYSNPYFEYKNYGYGDIVEIMSKIAAKWQIEFWNMYEDETMSLFEFDDETLKLYMYDWIHPTRAGYLKWWTPYFEKNIAENIA